MLAVLREAFATHPALPPGMPEERVEALLALMLDVFGGAERIYLHGIRRDGVLACIAFSLEAGYEPKDPVIREVLGLDRESTVVFVDGQRRPRAQAVGAVRCACGQWYVSNHPRRRRCFGCSPFGGRRVVDV